MSAPRERPARGSATLQQRRVSSGQLVVGTFLVLYGTALALNFRDMAVKAIKGRATAADNEPGRPMVFRVAGGIGAIIGVSMVLRFAFA